MLGQRQKWVAEYYQRQDAWDRPDPWVVEIVADVNLRNHFGLQDGDVVEIRVPTSGV